MAYSDLTLEAVSRVFLDNIEAILGVFQTIVHECRG